MFDKGVGDESPLLNQVGSNLPLSGENRQESVMDLKVMDGLQGGERSVSLDLLDHLVHEVLGRNVAGRVVGILTIRFEHQSA